MAGFIFPPVLSSFLLRYRLLRVARIMLTLCFNFKVRWLWSGRWNLCDRKKDERETILWIQSSKKPCTNTKRALAELLVFPSQSVSYPYMKAVFPVLPERVLLGISLSSVICLAAPAARAGARACAHTCERLIQRDRRKGTISDLVLHF